MAQALTGLRVIDLSMWWAGPFVTQLLGDLGAEIIKIESVQVVDGWRGALLTSGSGRPWEQSAVFNGVNRNKFGITLNLQDPRGVELCKRLVAIGDIVVENYTPRVMDSFGLGYGVLKEIKPDIIMISLPGYGSTGPWRDYPAFAFPVEEMAGFPQITGYPDDGVPRRWGNAAADAIAGLTGAYAVLVALEHRRRTGQGQHIDLSQVEALTCFLGEAILDCQVNHRLPERLGNRHPSYTPHGVYACKGDDKWVAIAVTTEAEWQALCAELGQRGWLSDPRFVDPVARRRHHDLIDSVIRCWTRERDRHEVMRKLQTAGVPAMPVLSSAELIGDEHMKARGYFQKISRAEIGEHVHGVLWAHFSETPLRLRMPAPLLGEHNEQVLKGLLGLNDADLAELAREQVIGNMPARTYSR